MIPDTYILTGNRSSLAGGILLTTSESTDELGLTTITDVIVRYPSRPWDRPSIGSSRSGSGGFTLGEVSVSTDIFDYITCTYYGQYSGNVRTLVEVEEWYELYSAAHVIPATPDVIIPNPLPGFDPWVSPGLPERNIPAVYQRVRVSRTRSLDLFAKSPSITSSEFQTETVSAVKKAHLWINTVVRTDRDNPGSFRVVPT